MNKKEYNKIYRTENAEYFRNYMKKYMRKTRQEKKEKLLKEKRAAEMINMNKIRSLMN